MPDRSAVSPTLPWGVTLALIAAAVCVVFDDHLLGTATFIGDSDRLNSYLNIRLFEYDSLRSLGRVPLWNDGIFAGNSMAGLHWMNPGSDPVPYLLVLFDRGDIFRVLGYVSTLCVALATVFAYLYFSDLTRPGVTALAAALVYGLSVFSLHRAAQVDNAHLTVVLLPLGLFAIRRAQRTGALGYYALFTFLVATLFIIGFLQEAAYALIYFAGYAFYRSVAALRHGERDGLSPFVVFALGTLAALILAAPRLVTVASELQLLSRTHTFHHTDFTEIVRLFHEGLLGRYQGEGRALGNGTNLHEGLQLLGSCFATLIVIAGILRPRTLGESAACLLFVSICGIVFSGFVLPYRLGAWLVPGLSRAGSVIVFNLAMLSAGVVLCALLAQHWPRFASAISVLNELTPRTPRPRDTSFHLLGVSIVLGAVLVSDVRNGVYVMFGMVDFTHSRLSLLAVLSLAALFAVYADELARDAEVKACEPGRKALTLLAAGSGMFIAWLIHGGLIDRLVPATKWNLHISGNHLDATALVKLVLTAVFLGLCAALYVQARRGRAILLAALPVVVIGCGFAAGETMVYGHFKIAGDHTRTSPVPFLTNNYLTVTPDSLRPPAPDRLKAFAQTAQPDEFRSIVISDPANFPSNNAPHIAPFWGLRLLGGYSAGVPTRLAALGWPASVVGLRSIEFRSADQLPARLLAMLNVRYAVELDAPFYFNTPRGTVDGLGPRLFTNPVKPIPRQYLAPKATDVGEPPRMSADEIEGPPTGLSATAVANGGILLRWSNVGPRGTARIEIYKRQQASAQRMHIADLGPSSVAFLDSAASPGEKWLFELRSCGDYGCTDYTDPLAALAGNGDAAPAFLRPLVERNAPGRYSVTLGQASDAVLVIEGRTSQKERFRELARLAPGETSARMEMAGDPAVLQLRARTCSDQSCSLHSPERTVVLNGQPWREDTSASPLFEGHAESILANPLVEGLGAVTADGFDASGPLDVIYAGDRIDARVAPSHRERFLVINELYHPDWHAYAQGRELPVLPANGVMRGIRLPAETERVELRFEPFSASWPADLVRLIGFALFLWGGWMVQRGITLPRS